MKDIKNVHNIELETIADKTNESVEAIMRDIEDIALTLV